MTAGLVLLALLAAAGHPNPGSLRRGVHRCDGDADDNVGPAVRGDTCPALNAARAERILSIEMRAVGKPWSTVVATVSCDGDDFTVAIVDTATGRTLQQGLFTGPEAEATVGQVSGSDREQWFARVLVELVVEQWGVVDPRPPLEAGSASQPGSGDANRTPDGNASGGDSGPAPTFTDWLGPNHIGIRAAWRWFNLQRPLPVAQLGIHFGRPITPRLTPFVAASIATGNGRPAGADVDTAAFQVSAGVSLGAPLSARWTCEADLGAALIGNRITLRGTGTGTVIDGKSGFAGAADVSLLFAYRTRATRLGFGISSGLVLGAPESSIPGVPSAQPVSINGVSLGAFLHVGSAPSWTPDHAGE